MIRVHVTGEGKHGCLLKTCLMVKAVMAKWNQKHHSAQARWWKIAEPQVDCRGYVGKILRMKMKRRREASPMQNRFMGSPPDEPAGRTFLVWKRRMRQISDARTHQGTVGVDLAETGLRSWVSLTVSSCTIKTWKKILFHSWLSCVSNCGDHTFLCSSNMIFYILIYRGKFTTLANLNASRRVILFSQLLSW